MYAEVLSFIGLSGSLHHQQEDNGVNGTRVDITGNEVHSPILTNTEIGADTILEPEQLARAAVDKHFPSKYI